MLVKYEYISWYLKKIAFLNVSGIIPFRKILIGAHGTLYRSELDDVTDSMLTIFITPAVRVSCFFRSWNKNLENVE